jgi:AraC-like DNA-binding protein
MLMNDLQGIWLLEAFRRGGVDSDELAERFPEPLRLMVRDPASVHPDDVSRVLRACQALSGDPNFGLHMNLYVDVSMLGILGYLLLNAPTMGQVFELTDRYYSTLYRGGECRYRARGTSRRFSYRMTRRVSISPRHLTEWTLGFFVFFIRARLDPDWVPTRTRFAHAAPPDLHELRAVFGPDLEFGQAESYIEFDAELADRVISNADPRLLEIVIAQAEAALGTYGEGEIAWSVRLELLELLDGGDASADSVARRLSMSRSTLKRRLRNEGLTFREVKEAVILELAKRALSETDIPVGDISDRLGYSEPSSFHRAFRRLSGATPIDFRRQHRG